MANDKRLLENHGTQLSVLKPSSVWAAAMNDLESRRHNIDADGQGWDGRYRHYAFHRKHVIKATSANDIIRAAIADPQIGRASHKYNTRLLYSDLELLKRALR